MVQGLIQGLRWLGLHDRGMLLTLVLVAGAVWGFVELAEVVDQGGLSFDSRLLLALRDSGDPSDPLGPEWLEEVGRDLTALGGVAVLGLLTLFAVGGLLLIRRFWVALYLAAAVITGVLLSSSLKALYGRPRPELVEHGSYVFSASFPSGHSTMATVTFFTIAAILAAAQDSLRLRAYMIIGAAILSLLVGLSRIYLGVHWPSDVLAGWCLGSAWALICAMLARRLIPRPVSLTLSEREGAP